MEKNIPSNVEKFDDYFGGASKFPRAKVKEPAKGEGSWPGNGNFESTTNARAKSTVA